MEHILRIQKLSKRFGTLQAIHSISFDVCSNEIVGIAGLSGSGKSVLANLLGGTYAADAGQIAINGKSFVTPYRNHAAHVEIIHQAPVLVGTQNITTNIFLGHEIRHNFMAGLVRIPNQAAMETQAKQVLSQLGMQVESLEEPVMNLTNEQRQVIAIARAMVRPSNIIIIDEPTVLLGYEFQKRFLSLIQYWQSNGKTIIFNSKNLDHLFAVTDRILVLRNGVLTAEFKTDETTREAVFAAMVGNAVEQATTTISALDNYYRAREKADLLYEQSSLIVQNPEHPNPLNQQLLTQLSIQVKALDQANLALQNAQRRLMTERERERKRLARELHDQVIQDLLTANYQLEEIQTQTHLNDVSNDQLGDVRQTLKQLIEDVRNICGALRPPTMDSLGLKAAIQSHAGTWSARTGIAVELDLHLETRRLPEDIELSVFRIIQEGLNNVYRHSKGTHVKVAVYHNWARSLMLSLEDNGHGLPQNFDLTQLTHSGHFGLIGISERVALLGGSFRLKHNDPCGLILQIEIPHPRAERSI